MPAIGMGVLWIGYGLASWGWLLLRGYDVTLGQWLSPLHPYSGPWPPPQADPASVLPGGAGSGSTPPPGGPAQSAPARPAGQGRPPPVTLA